MWIHKGRENPKPYSLNTRLSYFIDRDFQVRYTLLVIAAAGLGILVVLAPIFYFMNQNYQVFMELAYEKAPMLIQHLEREQLWLNTLMMATSTGLLAFFIFIGFKMTAQIVGPLKVLRNHLKMISRGNWDMNPIKVRATDEFQDLIESYNYFYSSYRKNIHNDLERIKSLNISPEDTGVYLIWQELIQEKSLQLNSFDKSVIDMPKTLNGVTDVEDHDSLRAS